MNQAIPEEKKPKKIFKLRKRIEDAQNFNKRPEIKSKTSLPMVLDKGVFSKFSKGKTKTEIDDLTETNNEKAKNSVLQSQATLTFYEVQGPQLKINKRFLSFFVKTGLVATESIEVFNNGSTAIYYEWNRVQKEFLIASSLTDNEERFYCHHVLFFF